MGLRRGGVRRIGVGIKTTGFPMAVHRTRIFVTMSLHAAQHLVATRSALNIASLLDLSSRLSEENSADDVLNAALLSIMGKLKVRRSCALTPDGHNLSAVRVKTVPQLSIRQPASIDLGFLPDDPAVQPLVEAGLTWWVPLAIHGELLGVLCFGPTLDGVEDGEETRAYLDLVRSIVSTAVHNARMVGSLLQAKKDLEAQTLLVTSLFESARDFTGQTKPKEILRILSYRLMGQLMISSFAIYLQKAAVESRNVIVNRAGAQSLAELHARLHTIQRIIRTSDLPHDDELRHELEQHNVGVVTPMHVHGKHLGALAVCNKLNGSSFTDEEVTFIESLGNTAIAALEVHRLYHVEKRDLEMLSQLRIAADIQRGLLPVTLPVIDALDIAAETEPSIDIGGDYYDVIPLDDDRTLFAIGDVSGKGIPAALIMANVQAALNTLAKLDLTLTQIAERINALVCDNTDPDVFVTLFLCVIHGSTGAIEYVNAGHNPPFILDGDNVILLTDGGVLTGVIPDPPPYILGVGTISPEAVLVMYTDGVTEARNEGGDEYGVGALVEAVRTRRTSSSEAILRSITTDVRVFAENGNRDDDTSIIVIKRS